MFEFDLRIKYMVRKSEVAIIYVKGNELRQIARVMPQTYGKLRHNKLLLNGSKQQKCYTIKKIMVL
ncbi:MAG: hypothetical protein IJ599_02700 [Alphaproteobacteria bacterium]|nr:hypothetical protein [Alphaproteobacteria bacterium]